MATAPDETDELPKASAVHNASAASDNLIDGTESKLTGVDGKTEIDAIAEKADDPKEVPPIVEEQPAESNAVSTPAISPQQSPATQELESNEALAGVEPAEEDVIDQNQTAPGEEQADAIDQNQSLDENKEGKANHDDDVSSLEADNDQDQPPPKSPEPTSKGAQILMNRFSSWRKKTNETISQSVIASPTWRSRFQVGSNHKTATEKDETQDAIKDDDDLSQSSNGSSSSFEEEGSASVSDSSVTNDTSGNSKRDDTNSSRKSAENSNKVETAAERQQRVMDTAFSVQEAATGIVDSVASGFRGRYAAGAEPKTPTTPKRKGGSAGNIVESQTSLILKSRAAAHMQSILDSLAPHEYVMLLGSGMLGVNLKQTYLRHNGVYMDYFLEGGAAESAGVVFVGDVLVKVGETDVQRGTIHDVPQTIAKARRPVVLIFSTGMEKGLDRVDYVDVAVAMMHKIREEETQRNIASMPLLVSDTEAMLKNKSLENGVEGKNGRAEELPTKNTESIKEGVDKEVQELSSNEEGAADITAEQDEGDDRSQERETAAQTTGPDDQLGANGDACVDDPKKLKSNEDAPNSELPVVSEVGEIKDGDEDSEKQASPSEAESTTEEMQNVEVPMRSFLDFNTTQVPIPPEPVKQSLKPHLAKRCNDKFIVSMMMHAAVSDENFRASLRSAFLTCALDGRRLPFLAAHFSSEDFYDTEPSTENDASQQTLASRQLMLFLELLSYVDLYAVTPMSRRRDIARRIAYKFFLPSSIGGQLEPPMFDFHHIVPDANLRQLEDALKDTNQSISKDLFVHFQEATLDSLAGPNFVSFLVSNECARMRAYLRNTAPFRNVPLRDIFDAIASDATENEALQAKAAAQNHFLYMVVHALCLTESEIGTENDDLRVGASDTRVLGLAGGITCALYIQRNVMKCIKDVKATFLASKEGALQGSDSCHVRDLLKTFNHLWEAFVAPSGGALEYFSSSSETGDALNNMRELIQKVVDCEKDVEGKQDFGRLAAGSLTDDAMIDALNRLSEELLYDYAVNAYPKFKEHKYHEWVCNEVNKVFSTDSVDESDSALPGIANGCIRRFLRRVDFPVGVSSHKPLRRVGPSSERDSSTAPISKDLSGVNAHHAIVFGTDDGLNVVGQIPNPTFAEDDVRRYVCHSTATGNILREKAIPPTLESYAVVPPLRKRPFSLAADSQRVSADGWEVSLIDFMIPCADASSEGGEDGSLFGVSLVFQKTDEAVRASTAERVPIELIYREKAAHEESPSDVKPSDTALQFDVNENITKFNRRLRERSWLERVVDYRSSTAKAGRVLVGIALVSDKNSLLAMRDTLSRLLLDFSKTPATQSEADQSSRPLRCGPLVNLLGNFSHKDVEGVTLKCVLEPYLRGAAARWIDSPLTRQAEMYCETAGIQLTQSLPPIPLALLFVTVLLEQKVVLSSSRRSLLAAATTAITALLKPLKWSHLLVPLVPAGLATDLVGYPAPYIIGIPSDDPGSMDLLNSLPDDVTLVDLDVGRVILAPKFTYDEGLLRGTENEAVTARALRSQVLYLAQALGVLFGTRLQSQAWCSDSALDSLSGEQDSQTSEETSFGILQRTCHSFLSELVVGMPSCCYWVEEKQVEATSESECTVLFDEDRFFHIKNLRAEGRFQPLFELEELGDMENIQNRDSAKNDGESLALSLDDFDLILETLLRCQSMSTYLSSVSKDDMMYY